MSMTSGFADVNGARLWYEDAGAGPAVVLLHGHLVDSGQWDDQFAAWAREFRVVRYDARGFGRSDLPAGPFGHHDDLRGLVDALGVERAALVGCSGGGMAAIDLALEDPARVSGLVLVGTGLAGHPFGEMPPQMQAMREARGRGDIAGAVELGLQVWTDGSRRPDQVDQVARERTREMMMRVFSRPPARRDDVRVSSPPAAERLGEIGAPALALVGTEDLRWVREIAERIGAEVPGARVEVIADAGHHLNLEHPARFDELALPFLRGIRFD